MSVKNSKEKKIIGYVTPDHFKCAFKFMKRADGTFQMIPYIRRKRWFNDDLKIKIIVKII